MKPQNVKLSEIKSNISLVLANLEQLETLSQATLAEYDGPRSEVLQRSTTQLLAKLEEVPAGAATGIQKHRIQRRRRRKQKAKLEKATRKKSNAPLKVKIETNEPLRTPKPNPFAIKRCQDAAAMLQTFDLLENLYAARGGDKSHLSQKLEHMRQVWLRVQQETETKSLASQWETVYFGHSTELKTESKNKLQEYRTIWDSYISRTNQGTPIPSGYVLPPQQASTDWSPYRVPYKDV